MKAEKVDRKYFDERVKACRARHRLQAFVEEFMLGDSDVVRVTFEEREYSSLDSARSSLNGAIRRMRANCKVVAVGHELYLVKN